MPPTPSSPSPTFSPPSSPKQRRAAELTAALAAEKLAESLRAEAESQAALSLRGDGFSIGSMSYDSCSESGTTSAHALERQASIAEWEAAERHAEQRTSGPFGARPAMRSPSAMPGGGGGGNSRKKRAAAHSMDESPTSRPFDMR